MTDPKTLLALINWCLVNATFPNEYKDTSIVLIKKKPDGPNALSNLRPIGLQSKIGKTIETMVVNRLKYHLETNKLLSKMQYGFKEGSSTLHLLSAIDNYRRINEAAHCNEAILTLDIKGAFDHVSVKALLMSLHQIGIPNNLYHLIKSYLTGRTASIYTHDGKVTVGMNRGITQGSAIGPLLFIITIESVLKDLRNIFSGDDYLITAYADDLTICITGWRTGSDLQSLIKRIINVTNELLEEKGLSLSVDKTKFMVTKRFGSPKDLTVDVLGYTLTQSMTIDILGITFDEENTYEYHVKRLLSDAKVTADKLARHMPRHKHLPYGTRSRVVRSLIHSPFTYGAAVWFNPTGKNHKQKIHPLVLTATKLSAVAQFNAYKTTPNIATLIISESESLYHDIMTQSAVQRQVVSGTHKLTGSEIAGDHRASSCLHPSLVLELPIEFTIVSPDELFPHDHVLEIFINGSVRIISGIGRAACGYMVINSRNGSRHIDCKRLTDGTSHYHSTLESLDMVTDYLHAIPPPDGFILLISTSLSLLTALNSRKRSDETLQVIRDKLMSLLHKGYQIKLVRLPSSVCSKQMGDLNFTLKEFGIHRPKIDRVVPMSKGSLVKEAKRTADVEIQKIYDEGNDTLIKKFFPTIKSARTRHVKFLPHAVLFFTGHAPTREYYAKVNMNRYSTINCPCSMNVPQTTEHVLFYCPLLQHITQAARIANRITPLSLQNQSFLSSPNVHNYIQRVSSPLYSALISLNG